jgi:hypothetical protein
VRREACGLGIRAWGIGYRAGEIGRAERRLGRGFKCAERRGCRASSVRGTGRAEPSDPGVGCAALRVRRWQHDARQVRGPLRRVARYVVRAPAVGGGWPLVRALKRAHQRGAESPF